MDDYRNRRGQAMSLQWVAYLLQSTQIDTQVGGDLTRSLLSYGMKDASRKDLVALQLGCVYTTNFILPLAIELALKALILQEGKKPKREHNLIHLYNQLSRNAFEKLEDKFFTLKNIQTKTSCHLVNLLSEHADDFIEWRYLDSPQKLKRDEIDLQIALVAILSFCN